MPVNEESSPEGPPGVPEAEGTVSSAKRMAARRVLAYSVCMVAGLWLLSEAAWYALVTTTGYYGRVLALGLLHAVLAIVCFSTVAIASRHVLRIVGIGLSLVGCVIVAECLRRLL